MSKKPAIIERCKSHAARLNPKSYLNGYSLILVTVIASTLTVFSQNTEESNMVNLRLPWERTVTDNQGRSIEVSITEVKDGYISFTRIGENQTFTLPIQILSENDQKFIENRMNPRKSKIVVVTTGTPAREIIHKQWEGKNAEITFGDSLILMNKKLKDYEGIFIYDGSGGIMRWYE